MRTKMPERRRKYPNVSGNGRSELVFVRSGRWQLHVRCANRPVGLKVNGLLPAPTTIASSLPYLSAALAPMAGAIIILPPTMESE